MISREVHNFMYSPIRESIPKLELEFDIQLDLNVNRFEIRIGFGN